MKYFEESADAVVDEHMVLPTITQTPAAKDMVWRFVHEPEVTDVDVVVESSTIVPAGLFVKVSKTSDVL